MKSNFLVLSAEAKCLDVKNGLKQTYWNGWFLALSTYQRKRDWILSSFLVYKNDIALDSLVIILLATYDLNIFNNIQGIYVAVDLIFECDKWLQKERDLEKSLLPLVSVKYINEDILYEGSEKLTLNFCIKILFWSYMSYSFWYLLPNFRI